VILNECLGAGTYIYRRVPPTKISCARTAVYSMYLKMYAHAHTHTHIQVRTFYIELLKRLDDSNDTIRCEIAAAFKEFLASVPIGKHDLYMYVCVCGYVCMHMTTF
jgi:hypothetical protein